MLDLHLASPWFRSYPSKPETAEPNNGRPGIWTHFMRPYISPFVGNWSFSGAPVPHFGIYAPQQKNRKNRRICRDG